MKFRTPELFPTLFFVASFVVMCTLGSWQLQRLQWKEQIMAETLQAQSMPTLGTLPQDIGTLTFRKVLLTGRFLHERTMHMIGRQQGENLGYYLLTPFALEDDGRLILVNRGFSPLGKETKPEGIVHVEGMLRPVREKRYFVPENIPEKNIWTHEDLEKIGGILGARLLPLILEATGKEEKGVYPIPNEGNVVFRNDHLGYALTWYALALTSIVMFGAYYRKK